MISYQNVRNFKRSKRYSNDRSYFLIKKDSFDNNITKVQGNRLSVMKLCK